MSHWRDAVVVLACGVAVVNKDHQAKPGTTGGPLQHLQVAVGVAEGGDWPLTDELLDGGGLALFVVEEVELRKPDDDRYAVPQLVRNFPLLPITTGGRYRPPVLNVFTAAPSRA